MFISLKVLESSLLESSGKTRITSASWNNSSGVSASLIS